MDDLMYLQALRDADAAAPDPAVRAAAQRRLREHVAAEHRGGARARRRRFTLVAAIASAALVGIGVVAGLNGGGVSTPPASARAAVERAARAAFGSDVSTLAPG